MKTAKEVIKSFECCIGSRPCSDCEYGDSCSNFPSCVVSLMKDALFLLKEKEEKNSKTNFSQIKAMSIDESEII